MNQLEIILSSGKRAAKNREKNRINPQNLYQKLLEAAIDPQKIKCPYESILEGSSPLGKIMAPAHPLSPAKSSTVRFNPQPLVKIFDAPELQDDFYLNVLDWSHDDRIAIAIDKTIHWHKYYNETESRKKAERNTGSWNVGQQITSLAWHHGQSGEVSMICGTKNGQLLAIGEKKFKIIKDDRKQRLGAIITTDTSFIVGGKDRAIVLYDIRASSRQFILSGHEQEVCGLATSPDSIYLASGGNDNLLNVWDLRKPLEPLIEYREHLAAIKAVRWLSNTKLISGSGTADRTIRLWELNSPQSLCSVKTGSQITSLVLSESGMIFSAHGYSDNWIATYRSVNQPEGPQLIRVEEAAPMVGHYQRVLWLCRRPGNIGEELLASASGDESIRIWRPFVNQGRPKRQRSFGEITSIDPETFYNVFSK